MPVTATPARRSTKPLRGISDIRRFFHRNETPVYFVSATPFNLLGIDEWVRCFRYINYIDCFDGHHPHVFCPSRTGERTFQSIEEIVNWLLEHKEVRDYIKARGPGKAVFLFFDDRTEALCEELGLELCFPSAKLRQMVDDKISATRIGDKADVPSVPNVLAKVDSFATLRKVAGHLGDDLVIQTSFGDSGHTTFFIAGESDWEEHRDEIPGGEEIKIMKRVKCRQAALEACATRCGTIVGPLMTELVGFPELTPYRGGWCGNEVFADAFTREVREQARQKAFAFGEQIKSMGYRGYFELDFLLDEASGELYLGEVNPRITGASSMTNLAAFAHADAPLFLFHLLEWSDVDFELDVEELNARWADPDNIDTWSQLVLKHTADTVEYVETAPPSGIWRLDGDRADFVRVQTHRRTVEGERQGFFLRIADRGDWFYEGADLGILVTPGRLMDERFQLNDRAKAWIKGMGEHYRTSPPGPRASGPPAPPEPATVGNFKIL